jgi:hypothetical protein
MLHGACCGDNVMLCKLLCRAVLQTCWCVLCWAHACHGAVAWRALGQQCWPLATLDVVMKLMCVCVCQLEQCGRVAETMHNRVGAIGFLWGKKLWVT